MSHNCTPVTSEKKRACFYKAGSINKVIPRDANRNK